MPELWLPCCSSSRSYASLSFDEAAGRTRKWWKKVLWYVMDAMVCNANAINNQLHDGTTSRRDFVFGDARGARRSPRRSDPNYARRAHGDRCTLACATEQARTLRRVPPSDCVRVQWLQLSARHPAVPQSRWSHLFSRLSPESIAVSARQASTRRPGVSCDA